MNLWLLLGIIVMVIGVLASNIMLLKYSAKFKMPKAYTPPEASKKPKEETPSEDKSPKGE